MRDGTFFRPPDSVAADFIPFFWDGQYHLFYLRDYRDEPRHGRGTPWWHIVTSDFVHFEDWGEALPRGGETSQDLWVFTGCVVERQGTFHIFYTGHNPALREGGKPIQAVMHATSQDLRIWAKDDAFMFFAPDGYEPDDWRDPFVYLDPDSGEYRILLAARKTVGPPRNRGCVALASSPDLEQWSVVEPFWAPDEYFTHECPDLFRMGDWYYLVYSTFSERSVTHYRMSRSLSGPWLTPDTRDGGDTFDGRGYYAAKTAGDGHRRFVFGWLPTREGDVDHGPWQWGGNLVVHETFQHADGALSVKPPPSVTMPFTRQNDFTPRPVLGDWTVADGKIRSDSVGRHSVVSLGEMPQECLIRTDIAFSKGTPGVGVLLRFEEGSDQYYAIRLEPQNGRVVFDRWPRAGDQPFMIERPVDLSADTPVNLQVIVDGTCVVAYVNDKVALSCRMYNHTIGGWGLFVTEGRAAFSNTSLATLPVGS